MRVYKFSGLSGERAGYVRAMLESGVCFFSPPASLNDPFEYTCNVSFDGPPLNEKVAFWSQNPELAPVLREMSSQAQSEYILEIERQQPSVPNILFQNGSQGVFCTCSAWGNLVLWSHYAENHKGIVIEIETDGVEILSRPSQVTYGNQIETLPFYNSFGANDLTRICSSKFNDWAYEREIRFFCAAGIQRIPTAAIKSVTFGMNCRKENYDDFREVFNFTRTSLIDCEIYEVKRDRTTFGLIRNQLDRTIPAI